MSETLFKFFLSELKTVHVRCRKCGAVAEVPVDDLGRITSCPSCHVDLTDG